MVPRQVFYLVAGVMGVLLLVVAIFALVMWNRQRRIEEPAAFNPMCMVGNCRGAREPTFYPERATNGYLTNTWCTLNAPKPDFMRAMTVCGADASSPEHAWFHGQAAGGFTGTRVAVYKAWYQNTYVPRCGTGWLNEPRVESGSDRFIEAVDKCAAR